MAIYTTNRFYTLYQKTIMPIFVFAFLLYNSPATSDILEQISFRLSPQGLILVEVYINEDGPYVFALDTGGGKTVISPNSGLFSAQNNTEKNVETQSPLKKRQARAATLSSISIAGASIQDMRVNVMTLSHISKDEFVLHGILGQDFMEQFDLEIDFPNRHLKFYSKAETMETCEVCQFRGTKIPFENDFGGLIKINFTLDDLTLTGILDTGTGITTVNKSTVFSLGLDMKTLRANDPNNQGNGRRTNISKITKLLEKERQKGQGNRRERITRKDRSGDKELRPFQAPPMKEYRIPISTISYGKTVLNRHQSIAFIDLPVFRQLGFRATSVALVGTDLFQNKTLRIANGMKLLNISESELVLLDP